MTQAISLHHCQSLQELDRYVTAPHSFRVTIGPWGGRKFCKGQDSFALNQLVLKLFDFSKKEPHHPQILKRLIGKIRALDKMKSPQVSLLRRILTAIRRFFGNSFCDRNALLLDMENRLPKAPLLPSSLKSPQTAKPIHQEPIKQAPTHPIDPSDQTQSYSTSIPVPLASEPSLENSPSLTSNPFTQKRTPPVQRRLPKKKAPPAVIKPINPPAQTESKLLSGWLLDPNHLGTSTLRLFKDITYVRTSPFNSNNSVEGLLKQCTLNKEVDLQEENSLLLLQGIFKFCLLTQITSDYAGRKEDLLDWLVNQKTLGPKSVDALIRGYTSRSSLEIGPLLRIVSLSKKMKENPELLGEALAKLVDIHANNNELERLVEYFIKERRITNEDYELIVDQFKIKRGQEGKAGMRWRILDQLQEYAKTEGFLNNGYATSVE